MRTLPYSSLTLTALLVPSPLAQGRQPAQIFYPAEDARDEDAAGEPELEDYLDPEDFQAAVGEGLDGSDFPVENYLPATAEDEPPYQDATLPLEPYFAREEESSEENLPLYRLPREISEDETDYFAFSTLGTWEEGDDFLEEDIEDNNGHKGGENRGGSDDEDTKESSLEQLL